MIPYGRQSVSEEDIGAVVDVLRSDFLTQGPVVPEFERQVAAHCRANFGVAASSATAALHIAYQALGLSQGDELWTSPITFVATPNAAFYCGAVVDFVDVEGDTGNMSVEALEEKLRERRRDGGRLPSIVVPVHLGGLSCDMERVHALACEYGFKIVEDASHAIGGEFRQYRVGSCRYSDITVFSFHPVKIMTTGEGGMAVTNDAMIAARMELLRSHGITRDPISMTGPSHGGWYYQQIALGNNYRMTEMQAALGASQLKRLPVFVQERNRLALRYDALLSGLPIELSARRSGILSAFHLYQIKVQSAERRFVYDHLRRSGIGVQIHYIPVHTQPFYRERGFSMGDFPEAEAFYDRILSLPMFFGLSDADQERVASALQQAWNRG